MATLWAIAQVSTLEHEITDEIPVAVPSPSFVSGTDCRLSSCLPFAARIALPRPVPDVRLVHQGPLSAASSRPIRGKHSPFVLFPGPSSAPISTRCITRQQHGKLSSTCCASESEACYQVLGLLVTMRGREVEGKSKQPLTWIILALVFSCECASIAYSEGLQCSWKGIRFAW